MAALASPANSFLPPANLKDLLPENLAGWSKQISDQFDVSKEDRPQFFNQLTNPPADPVAKEISWTGFPRTIFVATNGDNEKRWKAADAARYYNLGGGKYQPVQDEYLEWSVTRDPTGKITKVMFTAEGPEYWNYLAKVQPDTVLALYRQHISPTVEKSDLFDHKGAYIPENKWNRDTTHGAMHLICPPNSLEAEIQLAADASLPRKIDGTFLIDAQDLIHCAKYGVASRNSDPFIGQQVNALAVLGYLVSLQNPVGLYIKGLSTAGWTTPDGSDPSLYWRIERGTADFTVRAVYEVPAGKGFVVGDIKINSDLIRYGAQIADFVQIKLTGIAANKNVANIKPATTCEGDFSAVAAAPLADVQPRGLAIPTAKARTRAMLSHVHVTRSAF
jgi:hypothetical protein